MLGIALGLPAVASAFAPVAPAPAPRLVLPVVSSAPYERAPGPRVRHHDDGLFGIPFSAAFLPTLTVTKTDQLIGDDGDGLADPGETIRYTIEIGNSGPDDATGVLFDDTFDANTTFVPNSDNASPIAFDGSEQATPGTPITITLVGSDADGDDLTFAIETGPSDGTLGAIMGNGSGQTATVEYTANDPPSGTSDTFTFSVTDDSGFSNAQSNEHATVTIALDAAPEVDTVDPADAATAVAVDTDITITFTEAVNVTASAFTLECPTSTPIPFTNTTGTGPATTFVLDPTSELPSDVTCTLTVVASEVTDEDATDPPDNMDANFVSTFTTDAAPMVVSTTPTDGATDVPVDANIDITFSEDVSISSGPAAFDIDCTVSGNHAFTVSSSAAASKTQVTMYTLDPNTDFMLSEACTVTLVADEITDDDGGDPPDTLDGDGDSTSEGSPADDYVFTFTTPDAPPTVTMTELEVGDVFGTATTNIDPDTDIRFSFSEDVNFGAGAFSVVCATSGTVTGDYTASATPASVVTLAYSGGGLTGGETCTVTLESTAVTDDDAVDPPNELDGDNSGDIIDGDADDFTLMFTVASVAVDDAYTASGNIAIEDATPGVLDNDEGASLSVSQVQGNAGNVGVRTATTATGNGGVTGFITLDADGSFTYEPPPGFTGDDTFTYTAEDGAATETNPATVTITVSDMVWFIDASDAGDNLGTFTHPFQTLADFNAASGGGNGHQDNHFVYLYEGTYTGDGLALRDGQALYGDEVDLTGVFTEDANTVAIYDNGTHPDAVNDSGSNRPVIDLDGGGIPREVADGSIGRGGPNAEKEGRTANGVLLGTDDGLTLGEDNTVQGVNITDTPSGFGIVDGGATIGTPTIIDVAITGLGGAISFTGGGDVGNVTFDDLSSMNAPAEGILLTNITGTLTITASTTGIATPTGAAVNVSGGSVGFTFPGDITKSSGGGATVNISGGHTGTITFETGMIGATNGTGLQFDNADGTYNFNGATTLNGGDAGVDIVGGSDGAFAFTNTMITSPTGIGVNINGGSATVSFNTAGSLTQASNAAAVMVQGGHTGSFTYSRPITATNGTGLQFNNADGTTYSFSSTVMLTGGDAGIDIVNGSDASFTFGNTTITNPSGVAFNVDGSSGSITYSTGGITKTNNANSAVRINSHTSGIVTLAAPITASTSSANAIDLTGTNTGAYTFQGGLDLDVTTAIGFNATGGGTTNVCADTNCSTAGGTPVTNTIDKTGAGNTGVTISSTTIGSDGVTFQHINTATGTVNGILLSNTGDTGGGFTVTGIDGPCGNTGLAKDCDGGIIQNTTGNGVSLTAANDVSLSFMRITGSDINGIQGNNVSDFSLISSDILNNGDAVNEGGLRFDENLLGTSAITSSLISGSSENNIEVINTSGTLTMLTVDDSDISDNSSTLGADGLLLETRNTATANVTVTDSRFDDNQSDGIQVSAIDGSSASLTVTGTTFVTTLDGGDPNGSVGARSIVLSNATNADLTFDIGGSLGALANTFTNFSPAIGEEAINIAAVSTTTSAAQLIGSIRNNTFTNSGGAVGLDIRGDAVATMEISNNTATTSRQAIDLIAGDAVGDNANVNLTILNNDLTVNGTGANPDNEAIGYLGDRDTDTCLNIRGNTGAASGIREDILIDDFTDAGGTVQLESGPTDCGGACASADAHLLANNAIMDVDATAVLVAPGTCATPPSMLARLHDEQTQPVLVDFTAAGSTIAPQQPILETTNGASHDEPTPSALVAPPLRPMISQALADAAPVVSSVQERPVLRDVAPVVVLPMATVEGMPPTAWKATPAVVERPVATLPLEALAAMHTPRAEKMAVPAVAVAEARRSERLDRSVQEPLSKTEPAPAPVLLASSSNTAEEVARAVADEPSLPSMEEVKAAFPAAPRKASQRQLSCAAGSCSWTIGDLPADRTVTILFDVTVNDLLPAGTDDVCNQGTLSSNELADILSDDPDTGAAGGDPTCTEVEAAPLVTATKTDALFADNDANGIVSPGDVIEYTIALTNSGSEDAGSVVFDDTPDANSDLVVGSVTTTQGTVTSGNTGGDTAVAVDVGTLAGGGGTATITFQVTIADPFPDIDPSEISNQGTASGDNFTDVPTDDPDDPTSGADPTVTPVVTDPVISATKDDGIDSGAGGTASPGDVITYTITISNEDGAGPAEDVVFTDDVPANVTLVANAVTVSAPATVTSGNAETDTQVAVELTDPLAGGASVTITFQVVVNQPFPVGATEITNQGFVNGSNVPTADLPTDDVETGGACPPNDTTPCEPTVTPIDAEPLITATKDDGVALGGQVMPGDEITYTVTITNSGNRDADMAQFTDMVDPNTTLDCTGTPPVTSQGTVTTCDDVTGTVAVDLGTLFGSDGTTDGVATITFVVTVDNPLPSGVTEISNQGEVTADNFNGGTPVLTDDPDDATSNADPTVTPVDAMSEVMAAKRDALFVDSDGDGNADPGDTIRYTVTITNTGNQSTDNATFTDTVDENTTLDCSTATTSQGTITTCDEGTGTLAVTGIGMIMGAGGTVTITFDVEVHDPFPGTVGEVRNQGFVSSDDFQDLPTFDPDTPSMNDATRTPIDVGVDLELTKTASTTTPDFGSEVVFTLTVSSNGPADPAIGTEVRDVLPKGLTFVSSTGDGSYNAETGIWDTGGVTVASPAVLEITARVEVLTPITNEAEILRATLPDPDSTPGDGEGDDHDAVTLTPVAADLSLSKRLESRTESTDGETVTATFTLRLTNDGPSTATGVEVMEFFAGEMTFVSSTPSGAFNPVTNIWTVGTLAAGAEVTLSLTVAAPAEGPLFNLAEVSAVNETDPDSEPLDGEGDDFAGAALNRGAFAVPPLAADLSLTKEVSQAQPLVGEQLTYTITVSNAGPFTTAGVVVTDVLPEGVVFVSSSATTDGGGCDPCTYDAGTGVWSVGPLVDGEAATLEIVVEVVAEGEIENRAWITESHLPDLDSDVSNDNAEEDDVASVVITVGSGKATSMVRSGGEGIPETVEMSQNYPNPFNPQTTIPFGVPQAGRVVVEVYNVLGQRVAVLMDREVVAGRHEVVWQALDQPTGLYVVRLVAGATTMTKRITLVK